MVDSFLAGWGVGVGTHRDLESPISVSAHWDHFQRPQAAPMYRLWASWEVYYGLAPGFPDSSRGSQLWSPLPLSQVQPEQVPNSLNVA